MIILVDAEKEFDKIQHCFMLKTLEKIGIIGTFLNILKAIYANIILNVENMKAFLLKTGKRQEVLLSPLLFTIVLVTLAENLGRKKKLNEYE